MKSPRVFVLACVLIVLGVSAGASRATVVTYPAPAGEALSDDYQVHAAGEKVDVYTARTLDPPFAGKYWDFGGPYAFANFDASGPVRVRITSKKSLRSTVVRPQSSGIRLKIEDEHTIELTEVFIRRHLRDNDFQGR